MRKRHDWELNILKCFAELGGRAWNYQLYKALPRRITMEPHHLQPQWGDRAAYENAVRSNLSNLCDKQQLVSVRRGLHEITQNGRDRISARP